MTMMKHRRRRHSLHVAAVTSFFLLNAALVLCATSGLVQQLHSRTSPPSAVNNKPPRWRNVDIDYSAATEYIGAHYGKDNRYFSQYFSRNEKERYRNVVKEDVYDARHGVYNDDTGTHQDATLCSCGFELVRAPTSVTDWNDMEQIRKNYIPELRNIIEKAFSAQQEEEQPLSISHVIWWQPMFRGEGVDMSTTSPFDKHKLQSSPTAPVAAMVHIDTDVGALDAKDLVQMVERNRVEECEKFPCEELENALNDGHRFAIVNVWRNADLENPIRRAPLGLLATRYKSKRGYCLPEATVDPVKTRWYAFSDMTPDDCLIFKQYDRHTNAPSDLWHCALPINDATQDGRVAPPRRSFDIRALVVFDQKVPRKFDRFSDKRVRPLLSFEESKCFCHEQAQRRKSGTNNG